MAEQTSFLVAVCGRKGCTADSVCWSPTHRDYRVCADHNLMEWAHGLVRAGDVARGTAILRDLREKGVLDA